MSLVQKAQPQPISFTKNPIVFSWETDNYTEYDARMIMTVEMMFEAGWTEIGKIEKRPNSDHQYVFEIEEILDAAINQYDFLRVDQLNYDNPLSLVVKTMRQYRVTIIEYWGDPETTDETVEAIAMACMKGGIAHQWYPFNFKFFTDYLNTTKRFLTWYPGKSLISPKQPQTLFLHNYTDELWSDIKIGFSCAYHIFDTNTIENELIVKDCVTSVYPGYSFIIPAGPLAAGLTILDSSKRLIAYAVFAYLGASEAGISISMTYEIDHTPRPHERCFAFVNSLGGFDHIRTTGTLSPKIEFAGGEFERDKKLVITDTGDGLYNTHEPLKSQFNLSESETIKVSSGPTTRQMVDLFRDFRLSPLKFEYLIQNGTPKYVPILIDDKSMSFPKTGEYPYTVEFTYRYAFNNRVYTPNHLFS